MCLLKSSGDTALGKKRAGFTGCTVTVFVSIAMSMVGNVGVRVGSVGVAIGNDGVRVGSVGVAIGNGRVMFGNGVGVDNVGVTAGYTTVSAGALGDGEGYDCL